MENKPIIEQRLHRLSESRKKSQERVWRIVSQIPPGSVATYGQIAALAGMPTHARLVGRILSTLPADTRLPWHRVVNATGKITNPAKQRQQSLLANEGVSLINGRISLREYGWKSA